MSLMSAKKMLLVGGGGKIGQVAYTTAGSFQWTCPPGVRSICVVAVGGGFRGGGGLGWKNNIPVVPGQQYTVVVGGIPVDSSVNGNSYFKNASTVCGLGAAGQVGATGGGFVGDGGGKGGDCPYTDGYGYTGGGGGAGGYSGNGGQGGLWSPDATPGNSGNSGQGGGGGGGAGGRNGATSSGVSKRGGGVGIHGQGTSGLGGSSSSSFTQPGEDGSQNNFGASSFGRGGRGDGNGAEATAGALRIIWGTGRAFPSTRTGDL